MKIRGVWQSEQRVYLGRGEQAIELSPDRRRDDVCSECTTAHGQAPVWTRLSAYPPVLHVPTRRV